MADITLGRLRDWHPEWEWSAQRNGFGWEYVGRRAWYEVTVRAYSVLSGAGEDDYVTQWRAEVGQVSQTFAHWSMVHMAGAEEMAK